MNQVIEKSSVEATIATWKVKPREVAQKLIGTYGLPDEATPQRLLWHNKGPWKLTELVNEEIPHDFPIPHMDMLRQVIDYRVSDLEKIDDVVTYDGSVIVDRTKGELSARCDKEEANFLALNLAHDVASGKRNVADARSFYAAQVAQMLKEGKPTEYMQGFQFQVAKGNQGDPDKQVKPGA